MKKTTKVQRALRSTRTRKTAKIAAQYQRRLENPQDPKFKTPTSSAAGFIRRKIYRQAAKLELSRGGIEGKGGRPDPRLFPVLLGDVFDRLGKTSKGDRDRLRLIAHELEFAAEHRVPPKFLIGFIHQNGGSKGIEKRRAAQAGARRTSAKNKPPEVQTASLSGKTRSKERRKTSRFKVASVQTRPRKNRPTQRARGRV